MAEAKKRKGTALLAVMDENCSSCAGSPLCEAHCPVEDCINLLYEELPGGGLKPYRVFVDNDKCIGCQMCYSDDLTKIQQHKETRDFTRTTTNFTTKPQTRGAGSGVPNAFLALIETIGRPPARKSPLYAIKISSTRLGSSRLLRHHRNQKSELRFCRRRQERRAGIKARRVTTRTRRRLSVVLARVLAPESGAKYSSNRSCCLSKHDSAI